jgi:hypothetical protein
LKPLSGLRITKTAILAVGRVKAESKVSILQIDHHSEIPGLDKFSDQLDIIHLKCRLTLEDIQASIVCAKAECPVLLRNGKDCGLKIPES